MVAGHRLLGIHRAEYGAGGVSCLFHGAVFAVEIFLKRVLHAVLAHHGVVGVVPQRVFFVLLLGHQTHIAQQMGGIFGAVFAGIGSCNLNAGQLVFHDGGDQRHAGVLDEHIVCRVDGIADVDGIAQPRDLAHLLGGVAVIDLIAGAHIAQKLNGAGIFGYPRVLELFCSGLVLEIGLQHGALDIRHVLVVFKGRLRGNGQIIGIGIAELLYHLDQFQDRPVGIVGCKKLGCIDRKIIAFLIADQYTPVAVKDIPP